MKINITIPPESRKKINTNIIVENPYTNQSEVVSVWYDPDSTSVPAAKVPFGGTTEIGGGAGFGLSDYILFAVIGVILLTALFLMNTQSSTSQNHGSGYYNAPATYNPPKKWN